MASSGLGNAGDDYMNDSDGEEGIGENDIDPSPKRKRGGMPSQTTSQTPTQENATPKKTQIRWTEKMDDALINTLIKERKSGKKADNGWKPEALGHVVKVVRKRTGKVIAHENVRARLKTMKKDYLAARDALRHDGFRYDHDTKCLAADPDVWDKYIAGSPVAGKLRGKVLRHYDALTIIMSNDLAADDNGVLGPDLPQATGAPHVVDPLDKTAINPEKDVGEDPNANMRLVPTTGSASSMHRSRSMPAQKGRVSHINDDNVSSLIDKIEKLVEMGYAIASALKGPEWNVVEESVRCLPNMTDLEVLHVMEVFFEKPEIGPIFLGLSKNCKVLWVKKRLGR